MSVIETQPASGNNAMNMGVKAGPLIPGVQDAEETKFCAEVSLIASDFEKCFDTGLEQQAIDELLVL